MGDGVHSPPDTPDTRKRIHAYAGSPIESSRPVSPQKVVEVRKLANLKPRIRKPAEVSQPRGSKISFSQSMAGNQSSLSVLENVFEKLRRKIKRVKWTLDLHEVFAEATGVSFEQFDELRCKLDTAMTKPHNCDIKVVSTSESLPCWFIVRLALNEFRFYLLFVEVEKV
jgi:hypothetical protein